MYEDAIVKKKARVEEINRALDRLPPSGLIEIKGQLARVSSRSVRQLIEERIHLEQAIAELKAEDEAGRRSDSTTESIRSNARMFNTKMRGESLDGLRLFEQIMQDAGIKIQELRDLFDRHASHLVLGKNGEEIDIVLSQEFFSDLPGTPAFKKAATSYSNVLSKRMMARHTRVFHCKSGVPVEIVLDWPIGAAPHRDASYIHVQIRDLRQVDCLAGCSVLTTHQQSVFDIHKDPFLWQELTINSVRAAIDRQQINFFSKRELPSTLKEVLLDIPPRGQSENLSRDIESYIASKVFWLGFKRAGKSAAVWIGDPWDASYLQTSPMGLLQRAHILESKDYIALDGTNEFATASKQLLLKATDYETGELTGMAERSRDQVEGAEKWDIFISHASEDKEEFVGPLASQLVARGLRVWYDKFTLKLGDGLRESIDYGLRYSKFGVVVLSPNFFKKDWPKKELDGLAALEVNGRKVILPVWHNVTRDDVANFSPMLAGRLAVASTVGLKNVVDEITHALT